MKNSISLISLILISLLGVSCVGSKKTGVSVYQDKGKGQPYNAPWDRNHHTELVKRLSAEGARAVVFDIVFADPSPRNPEIDQTFATAIAENGKVILAIDLIKNELGGKESSQLSAPLLPYELFDEVCADIGYSALQYDPDFQVRRHLHQSGKGELISSLTWSTAQFLGLELTDDENNRVQPRWVNYYGPPRSLPWFSFSEVVGDHARSEPLFKDKIVYIGAHLKTYNSGERKDELRHPWSTWGLSGEHWKFIAGAEVHATILLNLLRGDWLNEIPKKTQLMSLRGLHIPIPLRWAVCILLCFQSRLVF